jgi:hypothetical protein
MTSEYLPVPVAEAKRVAELYQKQTVVVLAINLEHDKIHSTSYGTSAVMKDIAACVAEQCVRACGANQTAGVCFEDFREPTRAAENAEWAIATGRELKAARALIGEMVIALEGATLGQLPADGKLLTLCAGLAREGRAFLARKLEAADA